MPEELETKNVSRKSIITKIILSTFAILIVCAVIYSNVHTVDYVIITPGDATSVRDSISIDSDNIDETKGDIKFLTVLVSSQKPKLIEYLNAKYLSNHATVYSWKDVNGDLSNQDSQRLDEMLMRQSQTAAAVVALEKVGCEVPKQGTGATIVDVGKGTPASKAGLKAGDTITEINGQVIELDTDAVNAITKSDIGSQIEITYKDKSGNVKTTTAKLVENEDKKGSAFLGVSMVTNDFSVDLPIDVKFESGDVSGPSAGLAFTLTAIDMLSQGDQVNGKTIAATGEIDYDGNVYPVGGVKQKAYSARKAGADLIIVPKGEGKEAKKSAGKMKVVEVDNVKEALKALHEIGGDPVRQMRECTK